MAKKNKFLSWLGFGGKKDNEETQKAEELAAQEAAEQAKIEAERLAQEKAELLAKEQAAEQELIEAQRLAKEKAEQLAKEQAAEQERIEAQRLAQEKAELLAKEQAAEQERIEAQRLAQEKAELLAKEQAAEQERIEAQRLAQEKAELLAKEQAAEQERIEAQRLAQEKAELLAKEQAAEQERIEAQRLAQEKAEQLAKEQAAEQERIEAQRLAQEKAEQLAKEQAAEQERIEAQRLAQEKAELLAKEQAAEQERIEAQRLAQEKAELLAKEQAAEQERIEAQRLAQEQAAEQARVEAQRLAQEQAAEQARVEAERLAQEQASEQERVEPERLEQEKSEKPKKKQGFFSKLKNSLIKTKQNLGSGLASIFSGKKIDDDLFEDLETQLLTADLGVDTTVKLIDGLTKTADRKQLKDGEALYEILKQDMANMLEQAEKPLDIELEEHTPFVILMVGVNGVGKTTTIGKLAKQFQEQGKSVMLAAGDTFRAAAVEQLQVWGERNDIPVIAQHTGADSASVVFDALEAARARKVDVLIADTAGRLQNKDHLMVELEKISRVMKKLDPNAPHEVMLTIDAGTGQNAISQVDLFNKAVGLTGITLTKLDGTAKGGVIFAVADKFNIPIRYIGVGEGIDDLRPFKSKDFIDALFSQDTENQK
ncbi:signal recognition particle-docking protein FtsY [Pseudoalteromonas sp. '520P1 No. 423']|uniref:signal recognition particle-docking protein FtsY n=2 Tax=unclassified Pseudoalteromonas TaxID=194690 RepID=UPI0009E2AC62|nr:signal recognition particle-docking protein FtsY [Pseudoalteromonas sp. '520P1 No. 423']